MRKVALLLVGLFLATSVSSAPQVWPLNRDQTFKLGTDPTLGGTHKLDDGLGLIRVDAYDKDALALTITLIPSTVAITPDLDAPYALTCALNEPKKLFPEQACAFWGKNDIKHREYHFRIEWRYEDKDGLRTVVLKVKKTTLKLDH